MSVEPGHEPFDRAIERDRVSRPASSQPASHNAYNAVRHGNHVEESPDLLRWRADLLMDEMMMGGVDVSASDGNRTFSGVAAPVVQRPQLPAQSAAQNGQPQNGQQGHEQAGYSNSRYANGRYSGADSAGENYADGRYANGRDHAAPPDRGDQSRDEQFSQHNDYRNGNNRNGENHYDDDYQGEYRNGRAEPNGNGHADPRYNTRNDYTRNDNGSYANGHAPDAPRQGYERPGDVARPNVHPENYADQGYPSPAAHHPITTETHQPPPQNYAPRDAGAPGERYHTDMPPRTQPAPDRNANGGYENGRTANGQIDAGQSREGNAPRDDAPRGDAPAASDYPSTLRTNVDNLPGYGRAESGPDVNAPEPPRTDRLYAVEQQYEQFRREQDANVQPVEPPRPEPSRNEASARQAPAQATRPPLPPVEPARYPTSPPRVTPPPVDEHTQWATGQDKWEYQDFAANPDDVADDVHAGGQVAPERSYAKDSAVRHDPAQFVSAMSVMNNGKKRSTLLPRSTELDVDTLHREISDLHGEIAALLPVGNETSERARHLLDKAYSILQSDPSRSAEVEYYMQQVRTIVLRLRQSRQWSDLYRQRLQVYLLGWLGLSAMALLARFFFQVDLDNMLMYVTGAAADSWLVAHWSTFVGTAAAGALGGALGALYTMRGHARGEHSFFDRKYGLRGLILPFMGLIVGMVGYVIFGLVFALAGINPASSLTAAIIPTTAALAFGFNQESIYGTRG